MDRQMGIQTERNRNANTTRFLFQTNPNLVLSVRPCQVCSKRLNMSFPCAQKLTSEDFITFESINEGIIKSTSSFALNCSGFPDGQYLLLLDHFLPFFPNLFRSTLQFSRNQERAQGRQEGVCCVSPCPSVSFCRQKSAFVVEEYLISAEFPVSFLFHAEKCPCGLMSTPFFYIYKLPPSFFSDRNCLCSLGKISVTGPPILCFSHTENCPYRWEISTEPPPVHVFARII